MIIKKYTVDNSKKETIDKFLVDNELVIWCDIVKAIEYCLDMNIDKAEAFVIEPSDTSYYVYEKKFLEILTRGLHIYEKHEDYENCAKIVSIIKRIKS